MSCNLIHYFLLYLNNYIIYYYKNQVKMNQNNNKAFKCAFNICLFILLVKSFQIQSNEQSPKCPLKWNPKQVIGNVSLNYNRVCPSDPHTINQIVSVALPWQAICSVTFKYKSILKYGEVYLGLLTSKRINELNYQYSLKTGVIGYYILKNSNGTGTGRIDMDGKTILASNASLYVEEGDELKMDIYQRQVGLEQEMKWSINGKQVASYVLASSFRNQYLYPFVSITANGLCVSIV